MTRHGVRMHGVPDGTVLRAAVDRIGQRVSGDLTQVHHPASVLTVVAEQRDKAWLSLPLKVPRRACYRFLASKVATT